MAATTNLKIEEDVPPHRSPELISMLKKLTIEERAVRFADLCQFARNMMKTGIKLRNPNYSDAEVNDEFKRIMYDFYREQPSGQ